MDVNANYQKISTGSCRKSVYATSDSSNLSVMELQRFTENNEFTLIAEKNADNTVPLTLCIVNPHGHGKTIHFEFYLDSNIASIAGEMAEQLDLSNEDVSVTALLIDSFDYGDCIQLDYEYSESSSCGPNSSCGDQQIVHQDDGTLSVALEVQGWSSLHQK